KPGYKRVGVEVNKAKQQNPELLVSAYQSESNEELVFVLVNSGIKDASVSLTADGNLTSVHGLYVTSKDMDLEHLDTESLDDEIVIPARSVVTVLARP